MKATGMIRKIDDLGRMVLPIEIRRTLNINYKDPMEIYVEGDKIILSKYEPSCIFCGASENIVSFGEKNICKSCAKKIAEL